MTFSPGLNGMTNLEGIYSIVVTPEDNDTISKKIQLPSYLKYFLGMKSFLNKKDANLLKDRGIF
ncbi:hypothetical protein DRO61_10750 [Candidatus Bathyarchaeota archaeon]|nr:MAG: hypothetical protein DRO61_10750 [Candidatus Bathyarchaeota archaeon]